MGVFKCKHPGRKSAELRRYSDRDVDKKAEESGFTILVGSNGVHSILTLKCNLCNMEDQRKRETIISGRSGCVKCLYRHSTTDEKVKLLLNEKELIWVSGKNRGMSSTITTVCKRCNYKSNRKLSDIKNNGCQSCSGLLPYTFNDVLSHAKKYRFSILSLEEDFKNVNSKVRFRCLKCEHMHEKSFRQLLKCPSCKKCCASSKQRKLNKILEDIFNKPIQNNVREFSWLKSDNNLKIDLYVPHIKLAIEYDGIQHFEPVRFGGISHQEAKDRFQYTLKMDRLKDNMINTHIIDEGKDIKMFIRFNYKEPITPEYVKEKLQKLGAIKEQE